MARNANQQQFGAYQPAAEKHAGIRHALHKLMGPALASPENLAAMRHQTGDDTL